MSISHRQLTMGMPALVEIIDQEASEADIEAVFDHFAVVDERFSPYKPTSLVSQMNIGSLRQADFPDELREVLLLAEATKQETNGYFSIEQPDGKIDPSGIVKGLAIQQAANLLRQRGFANFQVDVGGDIAISGVSDGGQSWRIGIRHPSEPTKLAVVLRLTNCGIATSGTYERGLHIYNPKTGGVVEAIHSLTVIGPTVYDADRFATAAFAMGRAGIDFIESLPGYEGYSIDTKGISTQTSGFEEYVA